MTDRGSHSAVPPVIEGNCTAIAQRELNFSLALLACHLSGYRSVYLIGEPVFTGNSLQFEHILEIGFELILIIFGRRETLFHSNITHYCQIGRASCRKECRSRWSPYHYRKK